jgi:hypothetical protein
MVSPHRQPDLLHLHRMASQNDEEVR